MGLDSAPGEEQPFGDLGVGGAIEEQREHVGLATGDTQSGPGQRHGCPPRRRRAGRRPGGAGRGRSGPGPPRRPARARRERREAPGPGHPTRPPPGGAAPPCAATGAPRGSRPRAPRRPGKPPPPRRLVPWLRRPPRRRTGARRRSPGDATPGRLPALSWPRRPGRRSRCAGAPRGRTGAGAPWTGAPPGRHRGVQHGVRGSDVIRRECEHGPHRGRHEGRLGRTARRLRERVP